jgi:hypothetical protein
MHKHTPLLLTVGLWDMLSNTTAYFHSHLQVHTQLQFKIWQFIQRERAVT